MNPRRLTPADRDAVEQFTNFLAWGVVPHGPATASVSPAARAVPPAWFAYAMGLTPWCPAPGEW